MRGQLELFGVIGRWRRLPYYNLSDEDMERLKHFYSQLELFGVIGRWRRLPYYSLSDEDMERLKHF